MDRRAFLRMTTASLAGGCLSSRVISAPDAVVAPIDATKPQLISNQGCSRATAYSESNKIVTLDDRTHVAWLDSEPEGFRVKVRTLNHVSGRWAKAMTIGHAHDNHGGPALTVDSKGHLHIVYFPHSHPFRYRRSLKPNDASSWTPEYATFGEGCTYPTLMCGPDDTLYLTCRHSSNKHRWQLHFYWKKAGGEWEGPRPIMNGQATSGYTHFQESLAWSSDHKRLHLSCRIYDGKPQGWGHTIGYLYTDDFGLTWRRTDGSAVELPAAPETITNIAQTRDNNKRSMRSGALAVDPSGRPHVVYSQWRDGKCDATWAVLQKDGTWQKQNLAAHLKDAWSGWNVSVSGNIHVGRDGRILIVGTSVHPDVNDEVKAWGHPGNEIGLFESRDMGKTFSSRVVSPVDPNMPHWLPNMEKPTGFNRVDRPSVIYTAGTRADNNKEIVSNGVYWQAL